MRPLGAPPGCTATARSILHALHPSRPRVLPSSHSSPLTRSTTPLPHVSFAVQSAEQPSPAVVLLSSQSSHCAPLAVSTIRSPQRGGGQFVRHVMFGRFELFVPRSHASPSTVSVIASPHTGSLQVGRHAAFGALELPEPASLCSPFAWSMMPLPHVSFDLQSAEQPSPDTTLPSSHTSPVSWIPSPQRSGVQLTRHAALGRFEFAEPLSHSSPNTLSTIESPHFWRVQSRRHVAFGAFAFAPPLSHCSPFAVSMMPLPHVSSEWQSLEQPSPFVVLPSSQTSVESWMPSPQRGSSQFGRHASGNVLLATPLSQCSPCPGSRMPSPHACSLHVVRHG